MIKEQEKKSEVSAEKVERLKTIGLQAEHKFVKSLKILLSHSISVKCNVMYVCLIGTLD